MLQSAEPVFIGIDEKLTVVLSKTGGLESLEVQGTMSMVVGSDADAYVAAQVRHQATATAWSCVLLTCA
jgi:hypothetical protein